MPLVWLGRDCVVVLVPASSLIAQHLPAMAERNPDVLEVLISQIRENGDFDAVFSKATRVLGQSERSQPLRDRDHRFPFAAVLRGEDMKIRSARREYALLAGRSVVAGRAKSLKLVLFLPMPRPAARARV
jgi:hypothetical protein